MGPLATIVKSARSCPFRTRSSASSWAMSSSARPWNGIARICRKVSSAARPARRSAPSSCSSLTARRRPITGDAGANDGIGKRSLEAEEMGRPEAVRDRDPGRAGQQAGGGLVRVLPVSPGHQFEVLPHRRGRCGRPLELGDEHDAGHGPAGARAAWGAPAASGRSRSGRRGPEKARRRARPVPGQRSRRAARPIRSRCGVVHSLKRIGRGTIWKVTGVVPSATPSARTGIGRSDRTSKRIFAFSSWMWGSGTWSPCRKSRGSCV